MPDGGALDAPAGLDLSTADVTIGDAVPQQQNLMLWLNAATITGLADGGRCCDVAGWKWQWKRCLRGRHAAHLPVDQMNGLPIVRFDGTDDELSTAANFACLGDPSFTVTLVARISS